jgi:cell division protein FtsB
MKEFKKKQQFKRRLYSPLMLIVLGIILLLIMHATWGIYQKARLSERKLNLAEREQATLEAKKESIEYKIDRLNTETGIEEEIRSKFDVVRDGEQIVVIVNPKDTATTTEAKPTGVRGFFTTLFSRFQ